MAGPLRKTHLQRHTTCRPAETDVSHSALECYRQTVPSLCSSSPRVCQSPLAQCNTRASHYSPCDGAHPSQHSTHCPAGRLDDSERTAASTARLAFIALETNSCKSCVVSQTSTHAAHTALNMHPASPLGTVPGSRSRRKPLDARLPRAPTRTSRYTKSFFFYCSLLWNSLPSSLQRIKSTTLFQHNLQVYWAQYKYNTSSHSGGMLFNFLQIVSRKAIFREVHQLRHPSSTRFKSVFLTLSTHPDKIFIYLFASHPILDLSALIHAPHTRVIRQRLVQVQQNLKASL